MITHNQKYRYYLNDKEMMLKDIASILRMDAGTLNSRVVRSGERVYTETIMGYRFKAVKINN